MCGWVGVHRGRARRIREKDDLVQDMIDVLTSFCTRLYGRRSARRRAEKAIKAATFLRGAPEMELLRHVPVCLGPVPLTP